MRHMLTQIADRGQSAILIDPDCEFVQEFYEEKRGDVVLNPLDARCPFWSPWLEFREGSFTTDAEAMAASLIRGQARSPTEEFFRESSRTLIEAIFQVVQERGNSTGIANFLALPRAEIQKALTGTRAVSANRSRRPRAGLGHPRHGGECGQMLLSPAARDGGELPMERA
jgi:type IV secretory pathway TraG/TraD family ATPase VirD4